VSCPQVPVSATVFSFYIFTFLMFRELNKPQLTKMKQQNFIGIRAFDSRSYRYFKVFQVKTWTRFVYI
jgi:hypothetical protein